MGGLHRKLPGGEAGKVELQKSRLAAESREACQRAPGVLSMEALSNLHTEWSRAGSWAVRLPPTTAKARKGEICAYTQGSTLNPGQQGHLWAMSHFIFYLLIPSIINMDFFHEINKYIKHKIQRHKMCLFHTQI